MKKGRDALKMTDMALKKNETNMIDEKNLTFQQILSLDFYKNKTG